MAVHERELLLAQQARDGAEGSRAEASRALDRPYRQPAPCGFLGDLHVRAVRVPEDTQNRIHARRNLRFRQPEQHIFRPIQAAAADQVENLHRASSVEGSPNAISAPSSLLKWASRHHRRW